MNRTAFGVSGFAFDPWRKEDKGNLGAVRAARTVPVTAIPAYGRASGMPEAATAGSRVGR